MIRIAFVSNSFSGGGAELVSRLLVQELDSSEFVVSLIVINDWPDDLADIPINVTRLDRHYGGTFFDLVRSIGKFRREVIRSRPDFIVLNCELPELFSLFAPISIKKVIVEHTSSPWKKWILLGWIVRTILRMQSAEWVVLSKGYSNHWTRLRKAHYIPNPIVHKLPTQFEPSEMITRLFYIGRLTQIKQPEYLIHASVATAIPALLIGEGSNEKSLKDISSELNANVQFYGASNAPWNLLKPGDIVIVPSLYEGDGLVVSEAIITGTPLLLLDVPDLRRFGLPEINYFANQEVLNEKIRRYCNNASALVVSNEIKDAQISDRSIENVSAKWVEMFRSLTKAPSI